MFYGDINLFQKTGVNTARILYIISKDQLKNEYR